MAEFQVTRRINAIIEVTVNAENEEEAIEKSKKIFDKGVFKDTVTYVDGNEKHVGITNIDLWSTEIE